MKTSRILAVGMVTFLLIVASATVVSSQDYDDEPTITFTIWDSTDGTPVQYQTITLEDNGNVYDTHTENWHPAGRDICSFTFEYLPYPANYFIYVDAPGYYEWGAYPHQKYVHFAGSDISINIYLIPIDPFDEPPHFPSILSTSGGPGWIGIDWFSPSPTRGSDEITNYKIYRGTTSGGETLLATVGGDVTSYNDTAIINGQKYFYQVSAVNSTGEGEKSYEVSFPQTVPESEDASPTQLSPLLIITVIIIIAVVSGIAFALRRKHKSPKAPSQQQPQQQFYQQSPSQQYPPQQPPSNPPPPGT
ncbi:MAG: fibronectin type III domain-containing protein [Candidatus Thermoplasmatota archaeon]|nr:fibronectin type III domain-containing protein [Euryarchaeota archaeon]MBU4032969.1 fibronectin type III domain-containing protein [Candidatus Thermoplasmatota archaeon]MBU4591651.1 fibronectin type III domain-containing protein [Candidatus Thermoplasmatota archaeon]